MRYIDEEQLMQKLSRMIDFCEKHKVSGLTALFQVGDAIMDCPIADVVPKSEVEELQKKLEEKEVELMNVCLEKTNCDDMIQYILDFYFKRKVKDVFEEIEGLYMEEHKDCAVHMSRCEFAELKKKYTEGEK